MQIREHVGPGKGAKPAIILHPSGTVVTFDDLEARANRLAHHFRAQGLQEGDVVAILMENNEHMHAVMWAARRSGLYYVPINTHLTAAEAAYIIDNSGAKAIVGSAALRAVCAGLGEQEHRGAAPGAPARRAEFRRRPRRLGVVSGSGCRTAGYADRR
jgi:acyl-CoA synthetase (AMP-forming)/AMP-acid ligase II